MFDATTDPNVPGCPWCGAQPTTITIADPLRCPACGKVIVRKGGQLLKGEEPVAVPAAPPLKEGHIKTNHAAEPPAMPKPDIRPPPQSPAAPKPKPVGEKSLLKLPSPHMLRMPDYGPELRLIDLDAAEVILANIYFQQDKIIALLEQQLANQNRMMGVLVPPKAKNGTADERRQDGYDG